MSTTIDDYVVEMEFKNGQFEEGIKDTRKSLDNLKKDLNFDGAKKNIEGLDAAGKKFSLAGMVEGIQNIADKFSVLGAIGFTVIQNLTNSALNMAKKLAGAVLDPLVQGGKKRALNIEQAKFQFRGLGIDIEKAMEDANYAVLGTAYGLDEAARAASQLSASRVALGDDMKASLRGISGVSAMTNSSYEDTARIFTTVAGNGRLMGDQLNQLSGRGLNVAAVLADSFGVTEEAVRKMVSKGEISFKDFSYAMDNAFGENATKANETYTGSLANLKAALARIGAKFATPSFEKQRDVFNALSPAINKVSKAIEPLIDFFIELQDIAGSKLIDKINNFNFDFIKPSSVILVTILKDSFKTLMAYLNPVIYAFHKIFPPSLVSNGQKVIHVLGTIRDFIAKLKPSYSTLNKIQRIFSGIFALFDIGRMIVVELIKVFKRVFLATTEGSGKVGELAAKFGDFIVKIRDWLKEGEGVSKFFTKLGDILVAIIGGIRGVIGWFKDLFVSAYNFTKLSFGGVGEVLFAFFDRIKERFSMFKKTTDGVKDNISGIGGIGNKLTAIKDKLQPFFDGLGAVLKDIGTWLVDGLKNMDFNTAIDLINVGLFASLILLFTYWRKKLIESFGTKNILGKLKELWGGIKDIILGDGTGGIKDAIKGVFGSLTDTMSAMQAQLKAKTLMSIAIAIAILTVSAIALSLIDSKKLAVALGAMTVMFGQLAGAMALLNRIVTNSSVAKLVAVSAALILLAIAIGILSSAVKRLSGLGWDEVSQGLYGVTAILGAVLGFLFLMDKIKVGPGLAKTAFSLIVLSLAIKILAGVVKTLAGIGWNELSQGLVGLAAILAAIVGFIGSMAMFNPTKTISTAIGLVILGAALKIMVTVVRDLGSMDENAMNQGLLAISGILAAIVLFANLSGGGKSLLAGAAAVMIVAVAIKILATTFDGFASMSWEELGKAGAALAGSLLIIAGALMLMTDPLILVGALATLMIAKALEMLGPILIDFASLSWEEIGKIGTVLAGALLIIAGGLYLMTGALPGAAALIIVTAALAMFAPILLMLGSMTWTQIGIGLGIIAAALIILGVAGMLIIPALPGLFGLAAVLVLMGLAVALVGIGLMAAGLGITLFAGGLLALAKVASVAGNSIVDFVAKLIGLIPLAAKALGEGLIAFAEAISKGGPQFTEAIVTLITSLIDAVTQIAPLVIDMVMMLINLLMDTLLENVPNLVDKGLVLLTAIIDGFTDNVPNIVAAVSAFLIALFEELEANAEDVTTAGTDLIVTLIEGMSKNATRITVALAQAILDFLTSLNNTIKFYTPEIQKAGRNIAYSMADGMSFGLVSKSASVAKSALDMAKSAFNGVTKFLSINSPSKKFIKVGEAVPEGMAIGIDNYGHLVETSTVAVGKSAINIMTKTLSNLGDTVSGNMDANPTIRPVLDLSDIKKEAGLIDGMLGTSPLTLGSTTRNANATADSYLASFDRKTDSSSGTAKAEPNISIVQTNNSPKALSAAEIYRQTNNALSVAKGALKK